MPDPVQRVMADLEERGFQCEPFSIPAFDIAARKSGNATRLVKLGPVTAKGKRVLARAAGGGGDPLVAVLGSPVVLIAVDRKDAGA